MLPITPSMSFLSRFRNCVKTPTQPPPASSRLSKWNFSDGSNSSSCDIAIIGSGIMGLNVGYQIARRSDPNIKIKIFEKAPGAGYGSSGASSAILRTFYTFPQMVEFSRDAIESYKDWHNYLQCDSNDANIVSKFTKTGLIFFCPMAEKEALSHKEKFDKLGIRYSLVDDSIMEKRFPIINRDLTNILQDVTSDNDDDSDSGDDITTLADLSHKSGVKHWMLYEEDAGYFDPTGALNDLQYSINKHYKDEIEINFNSQVTKLNYKGGKVSGINVKNVKNNEEYSVDAPVVINCNGPWYEQLISKERALNKFDIELTLKAVRIQVIYKDLPQLYTEEILSKNGLFFSLVFFCQFLANVFLFNFVFLVFFVFVYLSICLFE